MRSRSRVAHYVAWLACLCAPPASRFVAAQVVLDHTLGQHGAAIPRSAGTYTIGPQLGRQVGGNLFFSFGQFDIGRSDTARFTDKLASGAATVPQVQRVLSRVTGKMTSHIDGRLMCDISGADFYLINPSGVIFGPDAKVDVKGSFAVSTAREICLADGHSFSIDATDDALLSSAAPAAFGFSRPAKSPTAAPAPPAPLEIPSMEVPPEATIMFAGDGDVRIINGKLVAPGGRIDISAGGDMRIQNSQLDTSTTTAGAAGTVILTANTITIADDPSPALPTEIRADTSGGMVQRIKLRLDVSYPTDGSNTSTSDLTATLTSPEPNSSTVTLFDRPPEAQRLNVTFTDDAAKSIDVAAPDDTHMISGDFKVTGQEQLGTTFMGQPLNGHWMVLLTSNSNAGGMLNNAQLQIGGLSFPPDIQTPQAFPGSINIGFDVDGVSPAAAAGSIKLVANSLSANQAPIISARVAGAQTEGTIELPDRISIGQVPQLFTANAGVVAFQPARVVLDKSFGRDELTAVRPTEDGVYVLDDSFGHLQGTSLLFSFDRFSVGGVDEPEQVMFTSADANIRHVLARVTAGEKSRIDGALTCSVANADFLLLNPAGIIFGPHAQRVEVDGAFVVTTAREVKLADGFSFSVDDAPATLSAAGFAFGPSPGPIAFRSKSADHAQISFTQGQQLSLIGGNITAANERVVVAGGHVVLASITSASELQLDPFSFAAAQSISSSPATARGNVTLINSHIGTDGSVGAGGVAVLAKDLSLTQSSLVCKNLSGSDADGISVDLSGRMSVLANSQPLAGADEVIGLDARTSSKSSGDIVVTAAAIDIDAGGLDLTKENTTAGVGISTATTASGKAGNIHITAGAISLGNGERATISSRNQTQAIGNAGNIQIDGFESLRVFDGARITTQTETAGFAGGITIESLKGSVTLTGEGNDQSPTGIFSRTQYVNRDKIPDASLGAGGDVFINVFALQMFSFGQILAGSSGSGPGGNIDVRCGQAGLLIDGLDLTSPAITKTRPTGLLADAFGINNLSDIKLGYDDSTGIGGSISVTSPTIDIVRGGFIRALTESRARAGDITVTAGQSLRISGTNFMDGEAEEEKTDTGIIARSQPKRFQNPPMVLTKRGPAGAIVVSADHVVLDRGGRITARTLTSGDGGSVKISAASGIELRGGQIGGTTGIFTFAQPDDGQDERQLNAGPIELHAKTVSIDGLAAIDSRNDEVGDGGMISITTAAGVRLSNAARINGSSKHRNGGEILITSPKPAPFLASDSTVDISGDSLISASAAMNGGTIVVQADNFSLSQGARIEATTAGDGSKENAKPGSEGFVKGGKIKLMVSRTVNIHDAGIIEASAKQFAHGGNIEIDPLIVAISNSSLLANAAQGNGGNITVVTPAYFPMNATLDVSSQFGVPGTVEINSPDTDQAGSLVILPDTLQTPAARLADVCGAMIGMNISSFISVGNGGVPAESPGRWQPALYLRPEPSAGGGGNVPGRGE